MKRRWEMTVAPLLETPFYLPVIEERLCMALRRFDVKPHAAQENVRKGARLHKSFMPPSPNVGHMSGSKGRPEAYVVKWQLGSSRTFAILDLLADNPKSFDLGSGTTC